MKRTFVAGLVAGSMAFSNALAADPPIAVHSASQTARSDGLQTAHKTRAILRYGSATTATCQSLSDASSTVCLLLALNVIHMSQQPLPGGAM
jgi:hypothetical protein